jgi:hypothetical protein
MLEDDSKNMIYKPRSGKANGNLESYLPHQYDRVVEKLEYFLHFFGYAKNPDSEIKNIAGFIDYSGK